MGGVGLRQPQAHDEGKDKPETPRLHQAQASLAAALGSVARDANRCGRDKLLPLEAPHHELEALGGAELTPALGLQQHSTQRQGHVLHKLCFVQALRVALPIGC